MPSKRSTFSPNWFVAIPVNAEGWYDQAVTMPPEGFRRFHPDDLHMTIAFLGGIEEELARAGWDALAWNLPPTRVTLGPVIPMGNPRQYSALSVELLEGRRVVEEAIAASRDAVCDAAGAQRERRAAKAHVTIARPARRATDAQRDAGLRWAKRLQLGGTSVLLDSVALYTWSEERRERQFRVVERSLAGR